MPLSANPNSLYQPSSAQVQVKYTPLSDIRLDRADTRIIADLVNNRIEAFGTLNVQVDELTYLSEQTIAQMSAAEEGKEPPLVVVSSNRSKWIKARYDEAVEILAGIDPTAQHYDSVMDTRVFQYGAMPFYLPIRLSAAEAANRNVYVFVEQIEYSRYRRELAGTGIIVVGWRSSSLGRLAGFGASRYAVLEFFKYINQQNATRCTRMWLFDDNVAYIRSFPGWDTAKNALGNSYGLGFMFTTEVEPDSTFTALSHTQPPTTPVAPPNNAPLLQQAVLWNVAQFNAGGYSFSPYFITSAEDSSLTKFLINLGRPGPTPTNCRYYSACKIFKAVVSEHDDAGALPANRADRFRRQLVTTCYNQRNAVPCGSSAVPTAATLNDIIVAARTGATSPPRIDTVNATETPEQTYSKALEQIMAKALNESMALPAAVFTPPPLTITSKKAKALKP